MLRLMSCLFLLLFIVPCFSQTPHKINHVIYITLDGVRWQDFYSDNFFNKLKTRYGNKGHFYGVPGEKTKIETASVPISLPSYQSQMSGAIQPCPDNECDRIGVETLPEALLDRLKLDKTQVATFASWFMIDFAIEHVVGSTYVNVGMPVEPHENESLHHADTRLKLKHPDGLDRLDKHTFQQATAYFTEQRPKFLWIALGEADEAAHHNQLDYYHRMLMDYDDMLIELFTSLEKLKLSKDTMVIVTTDHGRGDGDHWTDHGPQYPESKQTWAFVMNGKLTPINKQGDVDYYSTLSIRPTIEKALGIA